MFTRVFGYLLLVQDGRKEAVFESHSLRQVIYNQRIAVILQENDIPRNRSVQGADNGEVLFIDVDIVLFL